MSRREEVFGPALAGREIPVLTLDNKWHKLFAQSKPDKTITHLQTELNDLIKRQGKANTERKEIRKLKKKLMQEIMNNAEGASVKDDENAKKKAKELKRLTEECSQRQRECEKELLSLPGEIERVNRELMLATMDNCYRRLWQNKREIDESAEWIEKTRIELKERLGRNQELEQVNQELYAYMHDIFGAEVIDIFDMEYQK